MQAVRRMLLGWGPLPSADRGSIRLKIDISHTLETPSYTAELQVHIGTNGEVRNFGSVSTARAVIAARGGSAAAYVLLHQYGMRMPQKELV